MTTKKPVQPKITVAEQLPETFNITNATIVRVRASRYNSTVLVRDSEGKVYALGRYIDFTRPPSEKALSAFCRLTGQRPIDFKRLRSAEAARQRKLAEKLADNRLRRDAARLGYKITRTK